MLLRVSGETQGAQLDLRAVNGEAGGDGGVTHGALLGSFVEAVMGDDEALRERERARLRAALTPQAFVDACAVVGAFNVVDRIADATGIPLDAGMAATTGELRGELGLGRFGSSANTPAAT
jgi:alkylhydroperoxidase family enzyme